MMQQSKTPAGYLTRNRHTRPSVVGLVAACSIVTCLAGRTPAAEKLLFNRDGGVKQGVEFKAQEIDRACAALIRDLKQRDMLKDTLIVWAGEFGRTPMSQGGDGRDHHNKGFTIWLAGGGIKGGLQCGATDDFGYAAVENVMNVHDLHATMLHLLGIDHMRLTVKFQGLDARLTGVEPCRVIHDILA